MAGDIERISDSIFDLISCISGAYEIGRPQGSAECSKRQGAMLSARRGKDTALTVSADGVAPPQSQLLGIGGGAVVEET